MTRMRSAAVRSVSAPAGPSPTRAKDACAAPHRKKPSALLNEVALVAIASGRYCFQGQFNGSPQVAGRLQRQFAKFLGRIADENPMDTTSFRGAPRD
jgi:hypothetical protein